MLQSPDGQSAVAVALMSLAGQFGELSAILEAEADDKLEQRLVEFAVRGIPGAEHAALTIINAGGQPHTSAATDELPRVVDALQYSLHEGPCLEAAEKDAIVLSHDLSADPDFPAFGPAVVSSTPVRSMLSFRLTVSGLDGAALNLYATRVDAFTSESEATGALFAAYSSVTLLAAQRRRYTGNLERALASNREIGVAMGILMARELTTQERAFEQLREASQRLNRKLADIAREITLTGELPAVK